MKRAFFILLQVLLATIAFGQNKNIDKEIIYPGDISITGSLPFSSIKFIDERFDTTKLGYLKESNDYKKIVTSEKLSKVLQDHLNHQLKKHLNVTAQQNLLIIIKKLWMQQTNSDELDNKKITMVHGSAESGIVCASQFMMFIFNRILFLHLY